MKIPPIVMVMLASITIAAQQITHQKFSLKDLSFLKEELKGKQVVAIGEDSHFEGNVFELRTEIIKYLYEELGYTTIAFESGVYDVYKAQNAIYKDNISVKKALKNGLNQHWSKAKEFNSLFKFIEKNKGKLKLFGFDSQFSGGYSKDSFLDDFISLCKEEKVDIKEIDKLVYTVEHALFNYTYAKEGLAYSKLNLILTNLLGSLEKKEALVKTFYWKQIIKSVMAVINDIIANPQEVVTPYVLSQADAIRDKMMAANVLAYMHEFPKEKIICIGANAHFIKELPYINKAINKKELTTMGGHLSNALNDKLYSLALVTACEERKMLGKSYATPIVENSIESFIKSTKENHVFIKTRQDAFDKAIKHRFLSNNEYVKTRINSMFDGMLSFKKCIPYTLEKNSKEPSLKTYSGSVVNKKKQQEVLLYAIVKTTDDKYGTYIDKEGRFNLVVPEDVVVDQVIIDAYGFDPITTTMSELIAVDLVEKTELLKEVVIRGKQTPRQIVNKAVHKITQNYIDEGESLLGEIKGIWKARDTTFLEFKLAINQETSNTKFSYTAIKENIIKNTYQDTITNIRNYPFGHCCPFRYPIFNKKRMKKFHFTYKKDTLINGEEAYKISFSTPKKFKIYTYNLSLSNYTGNLYIAKENYTFLKIEHFWDMSFYDSSLMNTQWYIPKSINIDKKINKVHQVFVYDKVKNTGKYYKQQDLLEFIGTNYKGSLYTIIEGNWKPK